MRVKSCSRRREGGVAAKGGKYKVKQTLPAKLALTRVGAPTKSESRLNTGRAASAPVQGRLLGTQQKGGDTITSVSGGIPHHPVAEIFPMLAEDRLHELAQDIKVHGLLEPIVVHEDQILDGRCRYRACKTAGVEPRFENYTGSDPLGFVISRNLHRRHLTESQRAMVAACIANLKIGANQYSAGTPIGAAAYLLNVSARSVTRAKEVLSTGVPELAKAVEAGKVSVSAAAEISHMPTHGQRELVGAEGNRESATEQSRAKRRRARRREATAGVKEDKTTMADEVKRLKAELAAAIERVHALEEELDLGIPPFLDRTPLTPEDQRVLDAIKEAMANSPEFQARWASASAVVRNRFVRDVLLKEPVS